MRAIGSSTEREVYTRVASDRGQLFIDLGGPEGCAIRITADGWTVVESPSVRFRRTPDTRPLPMPERGGSINDLRPFLTNFSDDDFTLTIAILLGALQPRGPYAVLAVYGQRGRRRPRSCASYGR